MSDLDLTRYDRQAKHAIERAKRRCSKGEVRLRPQELLALTDEIQRLRFTTAEAVHRTAAPMPSDFLTLISGSIRSWPDGVVPTSVRHRAAAAAWDVVAPYLSEEQP